MGELKKVVKDISFKYDILSDIIVSPVRVEILRSLSRNLANGLSFEEIVNHIPQDMRQRNIQKHLIQLIKDNFVAMEDKEKNTY